MAKPPISGFCIRAGDAHLLGDWEPAVARHFKALSQKRGGHRDREKVFCPARVRAAASRADET